MSAQEKSFSSLQSVFPAEISALVNLMDAAEDLAAAEEIRRYAETRYNRLLRETQVLEPPGDSVITKRLGHSCLIGVERKFGDIITPAHEYEVTDAEGLYFVGDRVLHTPTHSAKARLRINGLVPDGADPTILYKLLVPADEIDGLLIANFSDIPEEQRFWPFEMPAPGNDASGLASDI